MLNKGNKEIAPDVFLRENYHLTHNPFSTEACSNLKEYVERVNELHLFESDINLIKISGCTGKRIIGSKGVGKTSLVNMCFEVARKRGLPCVYVTVPNSGRKFMQNLLTATINAETDESKRKMFGNKYSEYVRRLNIYPETVFEKWTYLIDEMQPKPVIVALDETDNLPRIPQITHLFNNYIFSHTHDVMPILCALPGTHEKIVKGMGAFAERFPIIVRLEDFSNNELLQLFEKRLNAARTVKQKHKHWPFTKNAVEKLLDHAEGIPRYLIDIARSAINLSVEMYSAQITDQIVERAAVRAERGNLIGIWGAFNTSEKQIFMEIAAVGGEVKLDDIVSRVKKDKSLVWRCVNNLVECGLVEKLGEAKKDVVYKLKVDPELVKNLKR